MTTINLTLQRFPTDPPWEAFACRFFTFPWGVQHPEAVPTDLRGGTFPAGTAEIADGQPSVTIEIPLTAGAVAGHRFIVGVGECPPKTRLIGPAGEVAPGGYAMPNPTHRITWALILEIP